MTRVLTHETMQQEGVCPRCGRACSRDSADVGVGVMYGPYGCPCGWSEWERYDAIFGEGHSIEEGYWVDTRGGFTRREGNPDQGPCDG